MQTKKTNKKTTHGRYTRLQLFAIKLDHLKFWFFLTADSLP